MVLNQVFTKRFESGASMTDHIAELELSFMKLSNAVQGIDELLQVNVLLRSISTVSEFESTVAAIRKMDEANAIWEAVKSRLMDEANEKIKNVSTANEAKLAYTAGPSHRTDLKRGDSHQPYQRRKKWPQDHNRFQDRDLG